MASLTLRGVYKTFGKIVALRGIDLDIEEGEFVVFVGPSGCGKSTLLRVISGLENVNAGELLIDGSLVNDMTPRERGISMVFQSYALYPHMTVYKNMAFGLKIDGQTKEQIKQRIQEVATKLQLDKLLGRKPGELSGGQRQRVAIGRAIVREPRVFLFDEPLSNLDAALRVQMRIEIARLQKVLNTTTIYVTHDQVEAMTLADKIVVLNKGRIEQAGTPMDLYHNPANTFVAGFIGSPAMNLIPCTAVNQGESGVSLSLNGRALGAVRYTGRFMGDQLILGIRPEHFSLEESRGLVLEGDVVSVERMGDITYLYLSIGGDELITIAQQGDWNIPLGNKVKVYADPLESHLFDGGGQACQKI